jgi:hypothetical protein
MAALNKVVFSFILHKNKTVEEIFDFCARDPRCKDYKSRVAKHILNVSGYKTGSSKFDYPKIFLELTKLGPIALTLSGKLSLNPDDIFPLTKSLKETVANYGSAEMIDFMKYNGFDAVVEFAGVTQRLYVPEESIIESIIKTHKEYDDYEKIVRKFTK